MPDPVCQTSRDSMGWKVAILLGELLLGSLVTISFLDYQSTACIEDSLKDIQVTFAKHLGEHEGIVDRINKLEAKAEVRASR